VQNNKASEGAGSADGGRAQLFSFFRYRRTTVMKWFKALCKDDDGVTAIEYGLLAALIAAAIITGATAVGTGLSTLFTNIGTEVTTQAGKVGGS
jgi:pilus assembly protein Flp/PilA